MSRWFARALIVCAAMAGASPLAVAYDLREAIGYKIDRSRAALREGSWDGYLTGYAWHAPWAYDAQDREELNSFAFGGGLGRSVVDADGDKHSLYGLVFRDSHYKAQYTAGYAWTTYWPIAGDLSLGLGYTVCLFARSDIANYFPLPLAGGLAAVRYGGFELMVAAVPGVASDSGNIALVFGRWTWN